MMNINDFVLKKFNYLVNNCGYKRSSSTLDKALQLALKEAAAAEIDKNVAFNADYVVEKARV